jgi:hypothetical protein
LAKLGKRLLPACLSAILLLGAVSISAEEALPQTRVGIRGSQFTINSYPTYTPAAGFPNADPSIAGTLLNVRAVQAIFDDANYPAQGSRENPYPTHSMGSVDFDYPDGKWDAERNVREFIAVLPDWRRAGLLAFTVNLQGGGPTDGNYGERTPHQPHLNSGFDEHGNLKPAYADRLRKVIEAADKLGMVVIVGFFYQGQDERIEIVPGDRYARQAVVNGMNFLKSLPYRNILVEINNETSVSGYSHPLLQPDGIFELVRLAQRTSGNEIPGDRALGAVDYVMFHTNGLAPEGVRERIHAMRRWAGYDRPVMINEDGVSTFNLHAAAEERVGWGYYDQGWNDYLHGFQSPPTNWRISTPVKWLFFEQVAKLTGSPVPERPKYASDEAPVIHLMGLEPGQVVKEPIWVEAQVEDRHPRWPIKRLEFFIDGKPYSYRRNAPFILRDWEWWDPSELAAGKHVLRVVAYDMRGPRFSEDCTILEVPFVVAKDE